MNIRVRQVIPTAVLLMTVSLVACSGDHQTDEEPKGKDATASRPALGVHTITPKRSALPVVVGANGSLGAWQEAIVGAEVNGLRVEEVLVNVGGRVRKGQTLATFNTSTVAADLLQAQANVAEAEAAAAEAAANAERARALEQTGALSASQINQYLTASQTARARLQAAKAALQAQSVRLAQTRLVSPDDGLISARSATVGAVVGAGTELFRLIRKGRLEWRAEVTSTQVSRLAVGTPVRVIAASGTQLEGSVRALGASVDPQTRVALVYADVHPVSGQAADSAKAGMFARGEFQLGTTSALTVPQSAVVMREGFSYLMSVGQDSRVRQLKVRTGRIVGDLVEILDGIPENVRVVAFGGSFLNEGDRVQLAPRVDVPQVPAGR